MTQDFENKTIAVIGLGYVGLPLAVEVERQPRQQEQHHTQEHNHRTGTYREPRHDSDHYVEEAEGD